MPVYEKAALLVPSGPSHDSNRKHLHIVCCDPNESGQVVIVSIASYVNDLCDGTCILQTNDHIWLRHKSYVLYRSAQIIEAVRLENGIAAGEILERDDINAQTFLRLRNGIINSPHTKRKVKRFMCF